jgi:phage gp36-like protein
MTAYATQSDLENRLGSADRLAVLLADENGVERPGALSAAIADAQEEIDMALGNRYPFPLTGTVPETVTRWTADLALAVLAEQKPGGPGGGLARKAERARAEIQACRAAELSIPGLTARSLVGGVEEPDKTFTRKEDSVDGEAGTLDTW